MSVNEIRSQTLPFTCLFVKDPSLGAIEQALQEKTSAYKSYFYNSPLIINIEGIEDAGGDIPEVAEIKQITDRYNFILIGFSGVSRNDIKVRIFNAGFPVFNALGARDLTPPPAPAPAAPAPAPVPAEPQVKVVTKVVQAPGEENFKIVNGNVRSGSEIQAVGCSLLVRGDVSNGAKVFADYDVVILGALRGRAVAGARGNVKASITCLHCDPELVSIGGIYKLGDGIEEKFRNTGVRITLCDEKFSFEPLG